MVSHGDDIQTNAAKGEDFCRRAASDSADVALFPEMWSIGYAKYTQRDEDGRAEWLKLAVPKDGPFVQGFRSLARELGMAIATTYQIIASRCAWAVALPEANHAMIAT